MFHVKHQEVQIQGIRKEQNRKTIENRGKKERGFPVKKSLSDDNYPG
ncbi:MAG TPA: hypothetical protein PKC30_03760 [Saprospiraceae bacterium]|nr:hypothetical protein [Saprospiraceae bacterium]